MAEGSSTARYCLDTSFFVNGWRKHWRPDVFPSLWIDLSEKMNRKTIFSCRAVFNELRVQSDDLFEWAKARKHIFEQPTEDHTFQMQQIMHSLPNFAAIGGSANEADPWVLSHALLANAIVVTDEDLTANPRPTKPPKIPNACEHFGLQWMSVLDFLHVIGIRL